MRSGPSIVPVQLQQRRDDGFATLVSVPLPWMDAMSDDTAESPPHFALWTGRAGLINTLLCIVLALPLAWGLHVVTERDIAAPACIAHGQAQRMTYVEIALEGPRNEATPVCRYTRDDGSAVAIEFSRIASFLADLWVGFALDMRFTWGAFIVLLGLARTGVFVLRRRVRPAA